MKSLKQLAIFPIAAAAMAVSAPAGANWLEFNGVSFETQALDPDTMRLSIFNADQAGGNWTGVDYLKAFEIKNIGDVTGATIASGPGNFVADVDHGLNANVGTLTGSGCASGGTPGACFTSSPAATLTSVMTWTIDFVGSNLNLSNMYDVGTGLYGPHLKVMFLDASDMTKAQGSLLSTTIPAIPEPETYAMMLAGLGLMAFMARRRRSQGQGSLVPA